jgi:hypothetical protein
MAILRLSGQAERPVATVLPTIIYCQRRERLVTPRSHPPAVFENDTQRFNLTAMAGF